MIARLEGRVIDKGTRLVLLDVGGVGYELDTPSRVMEEIAEPGETQCLYTHLLVREDAHKLFGFVHVLDRDTFRILLRTEGVGPSMALALLSEFTPDELAEYAHTGNESALCRVSGVGKKTAGRLCFNLKDKLSSSTLGGAGASTASASGQLVEKVARTLAQQLGFKAPEARQLAEAHVTPEMTFEEALQATLRAVGGASSRG